MLQEIAHIKLTGNVVSVHQQDWQFFCSLSLRALMFCAQVLAGGA